MSADRGFKAIVGLLAATPFLIFLLLYARLPSRMTMQWSLDGQANWQAPRLVFGAFLLIEVAAVWLVLARGTRRSKAMVLAIFALVSLCGIGATIANLR
jgi:uncharacterized membrane protein YkvI